MSGMVEIDEIPVPNKLVSVLGQKHVERILAHDVGKLPGCAEKDPFLAYED